MRYASKDALLEDIRTEHDQLCACLAEIPPARWHEVGVWGEGWTVADLVAHLAEWQRMFLGWYEDGLRGQQPELPARGYKWSETPRLNRAIREKHRCCSQADVWADFESGYDRIRQIVASLTPMQLLEPGYYEWTGKHSLTTYIGPNTASHYRFAIRVIKRWLKGTAGAEMSPQGPDPRSKPKKGASRQ